MKATVQIGNWESEECLSVGDVLCHYLLEGQDAQKILPHSQF